MADDPRELVAQRLARVYTNQMGALRDGTERGVGAVWDTLGTYNRADISPFLERALPIVEAAQTQAAALTDAYVAQAVQILTGEAAMPEGIAPGEVVGAAVRNGTAPETVYERSFIQVWSDLSDGVQWVDAVARGGHRARQAARTDVSLSARQASQQAMSSKPHIVGYRRVLDGHSCRFCAVASTQRYHKGDLMPLHPGCGCGVAPIVGDRDPGRVINQELLRTLGQQSPEEFLKLVNGPRNKRGDWDRFGFVDENGHAVPKGGKGPKVSEKAIRDANQDVKVVEHGELGPTLVSDEHHFEGLDMRPGKARGEAQNLSSRGGSGAGEGPPREPPTPGSGPPEWRPSMSRAEAEDWVQGSAIEGDVTHITSPEAARSIAQEGFDVDRSGGFGRTWGDGAYFATDEPTTDLYRGIRERFGPVSKINAKVRLENPFEVQVPEGTLPVVSGEHLRDALEASRPDLVAQYERRLAAIGQHRGDVIREAWDRFPDDLQARQQFIEQSGVVDGVAGEQAAAADAFKSTLQDAGYDGVLITQPSLTGPVGGNQAIAFERESAVAISE